MQGAPGAGVESWLACLAAADAAFPAAVFANLAAAAVAFAAAAASDGHAVAPHEAAAHCKRVGQLLDDY